MKPNRAKSAAVAEVVVAEATVEAGAVVAVVTAAEAEVVAVAATVAAAETATDPEHAGVVTSGDHVNINFKASQVLRFAQDGNPLDDSAQSDQSAESHRAVIASFPHRRPKLALGLMECFEAVVQVLHELLDLRFVCVWIAHRIPQRGGRVA